MCLQFSQCPKHCKIDRKVFPFLPLFDIMAASSETPKMTAELEFLNYINKLKHLDRTGWVRQGIEKVEPVAAHMYRMAVMSAFLVEDPSIDLNRCIKMSIVHDMGESIIGDITPHCGVSDQTKAEIELAAVNKLISFLPTAKGDDIKSLFLEYEEGQTKEARLVKDLDKFDMVAQAYEYEQREKKPKFLQQFFDSTKTYFETSHPIIQGMVQKLYEARDGNIPYEK